MSALARAGFLLQLKMTYPPENATAAEATPANLENLRKDAIIGQKAKKLKYTRALRVPRIRDPHNWHKVCLTDNHAA